jgi:hypothetical protein
MEANAPQKRRRKSIAPAIAACVMLGFIAVCIAAFIPDLDFADNLSEDSWRNESPIWTLPTVGKLAHYEFVPRRVSTWCGKVDMSKFEEWKQQLSRRDHAKSYKAYEDYESSWPTYLADFPAKLGLPKTFCEAGDKMFESARLLLPPQNQRV